MSSRAAADPLHALVDPIRRSILVALRENRSLSAGEIAARFPAVSRATVSMHLRVLRQARLVQARQRGREWHYSLDPGPLRDIYRELF